MTHTGVLATILSGLEPAVAIALACIPLMRPLFGKKNPDSRSASQYNSSKNSGLYSKKDSRNASRGPSTFTELVDDDSSEVHLQPIKPVANVNVSTEAVPPQLRESVSVPGQAITVERKWEVRHDDK
jgi:hypothetical protein